jgi:signal transduction histidine kinase
MTHDSFGCGSGTTEKGLTRRFLARSRAQGTLDCHGMRERAKIVGGQLDVWSELDSGTEVELSIPASRAYATPSTRRFLVVWERK